MPSSSLPLPFGVEAINRAQRLEQRRALEAAFAPEHGQSHIVKIDRQILEGHTPIVGYPIRLDNQLPAVVVVVTPAGLTGLRQRLDADHVELALGQQRSLGEIPGPAGIADGRRKNLQDDAEQHRENRKRRHDLDQRETRLALSPCHRASSGGSWLISPVSQPTVTYHLRSSTESNTLPPVDEPSGKNRMPPAFSPVISERAVVKVMSSPSGSCCRSRPAACQLSFSASARNTISVRLMIAWPRVWRRPAMISRTSLRSSAPPTEREMEVPTRPNSPSTSTITTMSSIRLKPDSAHMVLLGRSGCGIRRHSIRWAVGCGRPRSKIPVRDIAIGALAARLSVPAGTEDVEIPVFARKAVGVLVAPRVVEVRLIDVGAVPVRHVAGTLDQFAQLARRPAGIEIELVDGHRQALDFGNRCARLGVFAPTHDVGHDKPGDQAKDDQDDQQFDQGKALRRVFHVCSLDLLLHMEL